MTESRESPVFIELMEMAEKLSPGFAKRWETWATSLRDPEEPLDPRSLIVPELPYAIRGRGESLEVAEELREDFEYTDFADGWYYTIHARQGGGNDECWCETGDDETHEDSCLWQNNQELRSHPAHIYDEYGDDSTYITHVFKVDATDADVKRVQDSENHSRELRGLIANLDAAFAGKMTPWAAMSENSSEFGSQRYLFRTALKHEAALAKVAAREQEIAVQTEALAKLPNDFSFAQAQALGIRPAPARRYGFDPEAARFERGMESLEKTEADLNVAERKLHDAESYLPTDSPLREELLTDRGTSSYQSTEKRGRRNVKVTKTYERGSVLGFAVKNAAKRVDDSRNTLRRLFESALESERKMNVAPAERDIEPSRVILNALFTIGWENGELPEAPASFEAEIMNS